VAPFDAIAYGYGSCSSWATFVTYVARSVGIPARQVGTPCWNSIYSGVDYRGLAKHNPNVSLCWNGGSAKRGHGGGFLNNHNWVEFFIPAAGVDGVNATDRMGGDAAADAEGSWNIVNVPPTTKTPNDGLCGTFKESQGCGFDPKAPAGHECDAVNGGPGAAMRDHEIFAVTWAKADDSDPASAVAPREANMEGGAIIDVKGLRLSNGEPGSPLVWSPQLTSPLGEPLRNVGLRMVNRTAAYRCKPSKARTDA